MQSEEFSKEQNDAPASGRNRRAVGWPVLTAIIALICSATVLAAAHFRDNAGSLKCYCVAYSNPLALQEREIGSVHPKIGLPCTECPKSLLRNSSLQSPLGVIRAQNGHTLITYAQWSAEGRTYKIVSHGTDGAIAIADAHESSPEPLPSDVFCYSVAKGKFCAPFKIVVVDIANAEARSDGNYASIPLHNIGDSPLEFGAIGFSCSCLTGKLNRLSPLEPRSIGHVEVRLPPLDKSYPLADYRLWLSARNVGDSDVTYIAWRLILWDSRLTSVLANISATNTGDSIDVQPAPVDD
jgi:hypothetical protein